MKAIVTGSEGFIGKSLCAKLAEACYEVVGIDRKIGTEAKDIGSFMDGVDVVFHLAAQTSVWNDDLLQIEQDNMRTFMEVVEACNNSGAKLVYASSSTADRKNTTSMYGLSKRFNEEFAILYGKNATGVRLHNVYGREPREGTLLHCLMTKTDVTLWNNGESMRHFTYIDDAVEGLVNAISLGTEVVNVANRELISVWEFAELVRRYIPVRIHKISERRDRDTAVQFLNEDLHTLELDYTKVEDGIRRVFS